MTLTKCVTHLAGTKYLGGYFLAYMWNIFKNTHITLKKNTMAAKATLLGSGENLDARLHPLGIKSLSAHT